MPIDFQLEQFLILTFRLAMSIDVFEQSRPLYKPVIYPEDALAAYDRVIYYKVNRSGYVLLLCVCVEWGVGGGVGVGEKGTCV